MKKRGLKYWNLNRGDTYPFVRDPFIHRDCLLSMMEGERERLKGPNLLLLLLFVVVVWRVDGWWGGWRYSTLNPLCKLIKLMNWGKFNPLSLPAGPVRELVGEERPTMTPVGAEERIEKWQSRTGVPWLPHLVGCEDGRPYGVGGKGVVFRPSWLT